MGEIVTLSSKGQIIIPKDLREELHLDIGTNFAIFGRDDILVLKKIKTPTAREAFEKIHKLGVRLSKEKGWREEEVMKKIHKGRGINSE